ncbi:MAG: hypothetical protein KAH20_05730 [Methylococcales bacterium]|nr:hypothetical protein [Methylococcales bacterium]
MGVYTQHFNRLDPRTDHVFHDRYKAILVEKNTYFHELSRYIVLNPIRTTMVESIEGKYWSGYGMTVGIS